MADGLIKKIANLIKRDGPMTVDQYFALCLSDHEFGYYKTCSNPFGSLGDFVTSPEISQIFGEMLAIFLICAWEKHGFPKCVRLIELGPGKGTMMVDILRVICKLRPDFFSALSVYMVENSENLTLIQKEQLSSYKDKISWCVCLADVPRGFTFLVANEFFDSLPIKQFVMTENGIRERMIDIDCHGSLFFSVGNDSAELDFISCSDYCVGTIFETSPYRDHEMWSISNRLARDGGTVIIIDYGHLHSGAGDTLQAVQEHRYVSPLINSGKSDLSSHVDFQRLSSIAVLHKLYVNGLMTQGRFLNGLGIWQRAFSLMKRATRKDMLLDSVRRLVGTPSDKKVWENYLRF
ncbi:class I SAM-dependent methyltransferase [Candidatus Liberibacter africanus]|uniref:class I SAM-dependent methyltransferase n=1 Tax=Liberibacter africanus TaxID=34020 RepID=UPI001FD5CE8E|nr:SAM-dependent methyltransferase [Candidatus Liberibacter africanus]